MQSKVINPKNIICRVDNYSEKNISSLYSDVVELKIVEGYAIIKDSYENTHCVFLNDASVHIEIMEE